MIGLDDTNALSSLLKHFPFFSDSQKHGKCELENSYIKAYQCYKQRDEKTAFNLTTGFPTQADCYNAKNCCEITYPEYICDQVSILGPVGGTLLKCECVTAATGTGTYTGPNALYDCENDPTTCCSATTMPNRWKCTSKCNCVLGNPFDQYATLHDCQVAVNNNCCYTGVTKGWECVDFGKPVGCECVLTSTGFHSSKADCEAVTTDCCYTGTSNYDCVPGNNGLCKCVT